MNHFIIFLSLLPSLLAFQSRSKLHTRSIAILKGVASNDELSKERSNLKLDISQLKPFLKIAVPFFKEDKPARNSVSHCYYTSIHSDQ